MFGITHLLQEYIAVAVLLYAIHCIMFYVTYIDGQKEFVNELPISMGGAGGEWGRWGGGGYA